MNSRVIRRAAVATFLTGASIVGMSGAAVAGEVTGQGEEITVQGKSHCAYSGQNDGYHDPDEAHDEQDAATRTQTPGGAIRGGHAEGRDVGYACNGSSH